MNGNIEDVTYEKELIEVTNIKLYYFKGLSGYLHTYSQMVVRKFFLVSNEIYTSIKI